MRISLPIRNTDRPIGAMLSGEIAKRYGHEGLPETIVAKFAGTAGQSFGAFLARGVTFELKGDANDYVGKGLSGGRVVIAAAGIGTCRRNISSATPCSTARSTARRTSAVSPASASACAIPAPSPSIEGAGDHGCEYMTGGVVVVLGRTGRNFAAGMSGGIAYVLDDDGTFASRCNLAMVELEPMPEEEEFNTRVYHHARDLEAHGLVDVMADLSCQDAQRLRGFDRPARALHRFACRSRRSLAERPASIRNSARSCRSSTAAR